MATADKRIHIIGIGDDGLSGITQGARELIEDASLLIGQETTLAAVTGTKAERLTAGSDLEKIVDRLSKNQDKSVCVLVSGDPLFYGMARYLCDRLGKDRFEVVPHVSSMQLAFARVKESWEDAYLTNLASHPFDSVIDKIRTADTVGLFPSDEFPPRKVARALIDRHIEYFSAYVCENLGSPDERVTRGELSEIASQDFSPLCVMILVRRASAPDTPDGRQRRRIFGSPDDAYMQSRPKRGLLTPSEVRAIALAQMSLNADSIVWDIGAGSGSVAIEAAKIASGGKTFAIEMDAEDHGLIVANSEKFGAANLTPVLGRAPDAWRDLPDPDAVFIGGSGREIARLIEPAFKRLQSGGTLVANVGSMESLSEIHAILQKCAGDVRVWMINIARGTYQLERVRFDALNPTFLLAAEKSA